MAALFITSTGTDVGKTFLTAALAWQGRQRGLGVRALKPLLSGFDTSAFDTSDSAVLLDAVGREVTLEAISEISPVRFRAPLSPDMAAAREGAPSFDAAVLAFCRRSLADAREDELVLIEGVGGVMVPFGSDTTVRDWIAALAIPAVLVASGRLGTLSHTLTALEALASVGVTTRAVVMTAADPALPVPLEETRASLRRYTDVPVFLLPHVEGERAYRRAPASLLEGLLGAQPR